MTEKFPQKEDCIRIGSVVRPHGGDGQIIVSLYEIDVEDFEQLEYILLDIQDKLVPFFIASCKVKNKAAHVYFHDVTTVDKAEKITSYHMYVPQEFLMTQEDEILHEALDCKVFDGETEIGIVTDIIEYPMNSVLQVTSSENKEILLPYSTHLITKFDKEAKIIIMDLPEGLIDLQ